MDRIKFKYKCFGLIIESEILIPELLAGDGKADIIINIGKAPLTVNNAVKSTKHYQISKTEFLFSIEGVGKYYIKDGKKIIVQADKIANKDDVRVYLMGTAIGVAVLQKNLLPIHGSAIVINKKTVIFTGECGAGKSTMCAALRKKGYKFLGDDISVITLSDDGIPMVQSSFPQQRLCSDTAKIMGYDKENLPLASTEDDKYLVKDLDNFEKSETPLAAIVEMSTKEDGNVELLKIIGTEKVKEIIRNIYCIHIMSLIGLNQIQLNNTIKVSQNIGFYKLKRPVNKYTVEEQIKKIETELNS